MGEKIETLIKRYEATANTYEAKGRREWAYAKNGMGGEHYGKARNAFARATHNREKMAKLKGGTFFSPNSE